MDTAVLENRVRVGQRFNTMPVRPVVETRKMSFEEAVVECDGRPVSEFFNELRRQVKEHYRYGSILKV